MGVDPQANIEDVLESFGQFNTQVERELADECRKVRAELAASRQREQALQTILRAASPDDLVTAASALVALYTDTLNNSVSRIHRVRELETALASREAEHGHPTDEPSSGGTTWARLAWWKQRADELNEALASLEAALREIRDWPDTAAQDGDYETPLLAMRDRAAQEVGRG